jgi:thioredoxin 1
LTDYILSDGWFFMITEKPLAVKTIYPVGLMQTHSMAVVEAPSQRGLKMAGKVLELSDSTFDAFVESNNIVLVDCWAAWCRPCLMLAPVVEELAEELAGKVGIAKLNVDDNPGISMRFNISAIPTMLVFKDGVQKESLVGVRPKAEIKNYLMSL